MKVTFTSLINTQNYTTPEEAFVAVAHAINNGYQFSGFWDGSSWRIGIGIPQAIEQTPPEDEATDEQSVEAPEQPA